MLIPNGSTVFARAEEDEFLENPELTKKVKDRLGPTCCIYGTKGMQRVETKNVIFVFNECSSNYIAITIPSFDTLKYGMPLIASAEPFRLSYGTDYSLQEKMIKKYNASKNYDYDDLDLMDTKVFANDDELLFVYADDFLWRRAKPKQKCFFPFRAVYTMNKHHNPVYSWYASLDLFGIPCD